MPLKPSKPFPNGSTCMYFDEAFCGRCKLYKLDPETDLPMRDNCRTENLLSMAYFDPVYWPSGKIVANDRHDWICIDFESDDPKVMKNYWNLFREAPAK